MAIFSTWGKWDEVRVMIRNALLTDNALALDEKELDTLLLGEVVTMMLDEANKFLMKNYDRWPAEKKQLTLDSYSVCLGYIVRQLTERFNLSDTQKQLYLMPAIETANVITAELIDSLLLIGDFAFKVKNEILSDLYGQDFAVLYPDLVKGVYIYDPELSLKIQSAVIEKTAEIASHETPINQKRLTSHAIFMSEIIQQKKPDSNFEELFKQKTGKSMQEYKDMISQTKIPGVGALSH